jgi:L-asparagine oxygenase
MPWGTETDYAPDRVLDAGEHDAIRALMLDLTTNPYRNYEGFVAEVTALLGRAPESFAAYCRGFTKRDVVAEPIALIGNAPVDLDVPPFDFDEPLASKYELKTTFVAEGFLTLFALLVGTPAIGYQDVNNGDVFHDIYPKRSMATSQSQKSLGPLCFHRDNTDQRVAPDYIYMLGMRSSPANEVYTTFVRDMDIATAFTAEQAELLSQPLFRTDFGQRRSVSGKVEASEPSVHPILAPGGDLLYFRGTTEAIAPEHAVLVSLVDGFVATLQRRISFGPGDFVVVWNNHVIHSKEVVRVGDPAQLRTRWILKSVNIDSVESHRREFVAGSSYLVRS